MKFASSVKFEVQVQPKSLFATQVTVEGYELAASNRIVAISSGACGDADAEVATETWTEASPTQDPQLVRVTRTTIDFRSGALINFYQN